MTFIRKSTAFARTAIASFFEADRHPLLGASDLDFYLSNREARMDEAWERKRALNPISLRGRDVGDRHVFASAPAASRTA